MTQSRAQRLRTARKQLTDAQAVLRALDTRGRKRLATVVRRACNDLEEVIADLSFEAHRQEQQS